MAKIKIDKVVSVLPNPLIPNTVYAVRVGNGFDLYISDSTGSIAHKLNLDITTDESLVFDNSTNELRSNIGKSNQRFIWTEGDQEFSLVNEPSFINYISVNGQLLSDYLTQWSINGNTITIIDELEVNDIININYDFIITI